MINYINNLSDAPLVSIVTPSFNQQEYISAAINSVLTQSYDNIEYFVVDGASTDGTVEVLKRYHEVRWISEPDSGPESAIIKGFSKARGEIWGWLASDDVYEPDAVRQVVDIFIQNPDVDVVYGRCRYIDCNGNVIGECPTEPFNYDYLAVYNIIAQPSAFFRRTAYEISGGISSDLKQASDYDLWVRMTKNRKVVYLASFLSSYRLHYGAKTIGFYDPSVKFGEYIAITMKYYQWVPANRVYPYCFYRLKKKLSRLPESITIVLALVYSFFKYLRLNRRIDSRDFVMFPRNVKKLLFGWELEKEIQRYNPKL